MFQITDTVKHLIIINVLFWVATLSIGQQGIFMTDMFGLHFPENDLFKPWQLITHMFMHASYEPSGAVYFSHILFNMFGLWMFGSPVERHLGTKKFLFLYFSAGIGAVLFQIGFYYFNYLPEFNTLINSGLTDGQIMQMLTSNKVSVPLDDGQLSTLQSMFGVFHATMVGASGCIMGIMAAFGIMNPNSEMMMMFLPIPIKAKYFIPGIILLDLFSAISGQSYFSPSNTAFMAHVGGAIFGAITMWYWKKNNFNSKRWN